VQKKPGLSKYDATQAAYSLDELMEVAMKNVPEKLHKCTPLTLKATGFTLLLKLDFECLKMGKEMPS
jgi:guanosine-diphosphatase